MPKTLTSTLRLALACNYLNSVDLSAASFPLRVDQLVELADGTGANQANAVFSDQRTLAASGTENLDLAGGLTDVYGAALTFTRVKLLLVRAAAANVNDVLVGGAASNGFVTPFGDATDVVRVRPGGLLLLASADATGFAVTAGTGDLLKMANSAGSTSVTYDIVIVGVV